MSEPSSNTSLVRSGGAPDSASSAGSSAAPIVPTYLGPGMAYDAISQSAAIVIQDAASLLRQISAISIAAMAVCTEQLVKTQNPAWVKTFNDVTTNLKTASEVYTGFGQAAHTVLAQFQPGAPPSATSSSTSGGGTSTSTSS